MRRGAMLAMAGATGLLGACAAAPVPGSGPDYRWGEALPLSGDLVTVIAGVAGEADAEVVRDYTDCLASDYAMRTGSAFARHVRTTLSVEGGVWQADAVYTVSPALPQGLRTIDAETRVAACVESGIPLA